MPYLSSNSSTQKRGKEVSESLSAPDRPWQEPPWAPPSTHCKPRTPEAPGPAWGKSLISCLLPPERGPGGGVCVCVFALLLGARGEGMFGFFLEAGGGGGGVVFISKSFTLTLKALNLVINMQEAARSCAGGVSFLAVVAGWCSFVCCCCGAVFLLAVAAVVGCFYLGPQRLFVGAGGGCLFYAVTAGRCIFCCLAPRRPFTHVPVCCRFSWCRRGVGVFSFVFAVAVFCCCRCGCVSVCACV